MKGFLRKVLLGSAAALLIAAGGAVLSLEESYRGFQGQVFVEREGFKTSSDFALSSHYNLPGNYGDLHAGVYNYVAFGNEGAAAPNLAQYSESYKPTIVANCFLDPDEYAYLVRRSRSN